MSWDNSKTPMLEPGVSGKPLNYMGETGFEEDRTPV